LSAAMAASGDAIKIAGAATCRVSTHFRILTKRRSRRSPLSSATKAISAPADLTEHPAQTFDALNVLAEALKSDGGEGGQ
jgi:hypothetical protein